MLGAKATRLRTELAEHKAYIVELAEDYARLRKEWSAHERKLQQIREAATDVGIGGWEIALCDIEQILDEDEA